MATLNFRQIAANWIAQNNPNAVRNALVTYGIISNMQNANNMTIKELASALYNYYLTNGGNAYASLLSSIEPNRNISVNELTTLRQATSELRALNPVVNSISTDGMFKTQSDGTVDEVKQWWDLIIGTGNTTTAPTITTETKSSPVTIALIIGGIAVLAIIAWVVLKYR